MKRTRDAIPLMLVAGILPLVIYFTFQRADFAEYPWFPNQDYWLDVFLYGKSRMLMALGVVMLAQLLYQGARKRLKNPGKEFLLWAALAVLLVLSAVHSLYPEYSLHGIMEQYEPVGVLLSYLVLGFYAYEYAACGGRMKPVLAALAAGAAVLGLLGLTQLFQHDFWEMGLGRILMVPGQYAAYRDQLRFNFSYGSWGKVYMTLFNPNYAGIYLVMILPLLWLCGKRAGRIMAAIGTLLLLGTGSGTAIAAAGLILWVGLMLSCKGKRRVLLGTVAAVCVLGGCLWGFVSGGHQNIPLEKVETGSDAVLLTYNGIDLSFGYEITETGNPKQLVTYADGTKVPLDWSDERGECDPQDENLAGLHFRVYKKDEIYYIQFRCDDVTFRFTDSLGTGRFEYVTINGKVDELTDAQTAFQGADSLLTGRGYIWSRTLPVLGRHLLLGTGPDTFMLVFPQNDYVARSRLGQETFSSILTNAHSAYLQMAVQTGLPALLCFLAIAGSYLRKTRKHFLGNEFNRETDRLELALFLGVLGYLVCGLTWTSSVCTTPIFWLFLGLGTGIRKRK